MNIVRVAAFAALFLTAAVASSCGESARDIVSDADGEVISGMTARATGGGAPFRGEVRRPSDLDDLVETAWGDGAFGLHRGHAPIEKVLSAFLGITHRQMHIFMEDENLNLAEICEVFGFAPENLVATLTASFAPYVRQAADNGIISAAEAAEWTEKIRAAFRARVNWRGQ